MEPDQQKIPRPEGVDRDSDGKTFRGKSLLKHGIDDELFTARGQGGPTGPTHRLVERLVVKARGAAFKSRPWSGLSGTLRQPEVA